MPIIIRVGQSFNKINVMWFVLSIIGLMLFTDIWWWYFVHRKVRKAGFKPYWSWIISLTMVPAVVGLLLLFLARLIRLESMIMPEWAVKLVFIWHFLVLPLIFLPLIAGRMFIWFRRVIRPVRDNEDGVDPSRRAFLTQAMVVVPPVVTLAMTGQSVMARDDFRIRRIDVRLKQLPAALEGLTIAQVTDPHVGSFMSDYKYREIIRTTNELDADLVLNGGDLINHSLKDLPDGIQMLRKMQGRYGVFSCQGNHDCIDNRELFETSTRRAGVGMLLDESTVIRIRGYPVQILAPRWSGRSDSDVWNGVNRVLTQRRSDTFAILLAHHPHSFDAAQQAGIPLTLAGHTHGGQVQLIPEIGFGPLMYRYWSGLYERGDCSAVISNGIGNWFPLRVNVPCEIIHLTLRRA